MRRRFSLTCGFLVALALGGCGGGSAANPTSGSGSLPGGVIASPEVTGTSTTSSGSVTSPAVTGTSAASSGSVAGPATTGPSTVPTGASLAADIGVNIHEGGGTTTANDQIASIMASRGLKQARLDYYVNTDTSGIRDQITKINANGGKAQLVLQNSYQWDYSCSQDLSGVENDSYNQTYQMVGSMKDLVHDYEILNEIQLRPDVGGQVAWNSQNGSTSTYNASPCSATLAAVARGMSRAIHDQGQRVILGEVGRDWGFLIYMQSKGVTWDVTGFHVYPHYDDASLSSDTWYGTGGPLAQLAAFGKPVTINEFNCGEIYDSNYENQAGMADTETCLQSFTRHMTDLRSQKIVNLESVIVYELLDEPSKSAPENRFGLMSTLTDPKPELFLVDAFAGGSLTAAEQQTITSRGLLTDSQIATMKQAGTR
jgi:hypothetical protein